MLHNFTTKSKVTEVSQAKLKSKMQNIIDVQIPGVTKAIATKLEQAEDNIETVYSQMNFFELQALKVLLLVYGENSAKYKLPESCVLKEFDLMCFKLMDLFGHNLRDTTTVSFENYLRLSEIFELLKKQDVMIYEPQEDNYEISTAPRLL